MKLIIKKINSNEYKIAYRDKGKYVSFNGYKTSNNFDTVCKLYTGAEVQLIKKLDILENRTSNK